MGKARTLALVAVLGLVACGGGDKSGDGDAAARRGSSAAAGESPAALGVEPLPQGKWTELARALVHARTRDGSMDATREILARGGIATTDGDRLLAEAIGPASRLQATPLETVGLAMQARHRAHAGALTVSEVAQMLESLGWPFPDADPDADAYQARPALAPED